MSTWLDHRYVGLLSARLRNFHRVNSRTYNFSCPICGDSEKNRKKRRGYVFEKRGKLVFYCHNCGASSSVSRFIKSVDSALYEEYRLEKFRELMEERREVPLEVRMEPPKFTDFGLLDELPRISQLDADDPVRRIVEGRRIPETYLSKLFKCENFKRFVNTIEPDKFDEESLKYDETRLLIPFFNKDKKLHAFQGRTVVPSSNRAKYVAIVIDHTVPKVFGLDTVDFSRKTYVVEGPFDSMFLPNSVATGGGSLLNPMTDLKKYDETFDADNIVIVYDNEPRNREVAMHVKRAADAGYRVCIWPNELPYKDVNDMILAGMSRDDVVSLIDSYTFRGLKANLEFNRWKKY
jgi:transcription elongation factor Elf1